ncbi:hypothetical protein [Georgenia sp. AZ-5]|uniref:hypothetical protein n=1 Tax=Georgenia sp. AZ-5 TaxID=3367526 RepID=UPI003754F707
MSDLSILNDDMHDAFDPVLDETLTDPVTGMEVVVDGFDGPATILLLVPHEFDHPYAEDVEDVDEELKRVRGGEELWGPLVPAAQAVLEGDELGVAEDLDADDVDEEMLAPAVDDDFEEFDLDDEDEDEEEDARR